MHFCSLNIHCNYCFVFVLQKAQIHFKHNLWVKIDHTIYTVIQLTVEYPLVNEAYQKVLCIF